MTRPHALMAALLVALPALAAPAHAAPRVEAAGKVVKVTVYPDRAEVVREATVQLPAGAADVVFGGLPLSVDPVSLRASARGVPAAIGAIELAWQAQAPRRPEDYAAAEKEVKRLEGELAALDAQDAVAKDMLLYLRALRATSAESAASKLGELKADTTAVSALYTLLDTRFSELAAKDLARRTRRAELQEALTVARAQLDAARSSAPVRTRTATVTCEAKQAGALTVTLAYVVTGASWTPSYRAALDAEKNEIRFDAEALVRQDTGEDWSGVELALSTAAPARGVEVPELTSWVLHPYVAPPPASASFGMARGVAAPELREEVVVRGNEKVVELDSERAPVEAEPIVANMIHTDYNVSFAVPGRSDVPADAHEHLVVLRRDTLPATLSYSSVPGREAAAFLVAKAVSPKDYPLLAGPVRIFAGPAFLGTWNAAETGPAADVTLPFGRDNRLAVKRVVLPEQHTREGFTGKDRQVARRVRTTLENLRDRAVEIVVQDQVPVSEDERIKVEMGEGTTKGARPVPDKPGVYEWTVSLAPREKKELALEYTVRHPKDIVVQGL